jgi:outer membrane immunogenic protein
MKRFLLAGLVAVVAVPAMAADMAPAPAPYYKAPIPVPVYSWNGFYIGGNVGYSWGDARTSIAGNATAVAQQPFFGGFPGNNIAFADSNSTRPDGVIGGGQIGYNYQFNPTWVLGLEADFQGTGERGSNSFTDPFSRTICTESVGPAPTCTLTGPLNGTAATSYDAKIDWFGTVRGRLGFLITDQVLLYGTGGLAYGQVEVSGTTNVTGVVTTNIVGPAPLTPGTSAFSSSKTSVGFAVGAGIEGKFSYWLPANWTWKLEYLYVDLGSVGSLAPFPGGPALNAAYAGGQVLSAFTGAIATHTSFTDNIVRVGVNYQFH